MKIAVIGAGYVGLSLAVLLSQNNEVIIVDIVEEKVDLINKRISPILDHEISDFFSNNKLNLKASTNFEEAVKGALYVIVATPTNYDEKVNYFDTSSVDSVIANTIKLNPKATIVIKSTKPVGFTKSRQEQNQSDNIIFLQIFKARLI